MRKKLFLIVMNLLFGISIFGQVPSGVEILKLIDKNLVFDKAETVTTMIIHGRAGTRTVQSKNWIEGKDKAFVEYTDPAREKGKKMLKLGDQLWNYIPEPTDRIHHDFRPQSRTDRARVGSAEAPQDAPAEALRMAAAGGGGPGGLA